MGKIKRKKLVRQINIATTGHRNWKDPIKEKKRFFDSLDTFFCLLDKFGIDTSMVRLLHGCARGVDLWTGEYALKNFIDLELYLPFKYSTQIIKGKFSQLERKKLRNQMFEALKVEVVNKSYHTVGYERRNRVLVSSCDFLLTYYVRERSGSGNARRFADLMRKRIYDLRYIGGKSDLDLTMHDLKLLME